MEAYLSHAYNASQSAKSRQPFRRDPLDAGIVASRTLGVRFHTLRACKIDFIIGYMHDYCRRLFRPLSKSEIGSSRSNIEGHLLMWTNVRSLAFWAQMNWHHQEIFDGHLSTSYESLGREEWKVLKAFTPCLVVSSEGR